MFSDYTLFIDESGDHGLVSIDRHYPVFVLCGVLVKKEHYVRQLCPRLSRLKMEFWGHDEVVLHDHDIRKPKGSFSFLQIAEKRTRFMQGISSIFAECNFQLIYSVIRKLEYVERYREPMNPYDLSMSFVLERAFLELHSIGQGAKKTTVVVECRGRNEDAQLREAFDRIVAGNNATGRALPFDLLMIPKVANSAGLQVADLAARPMGIRTLRPEHPNAAYEALEPRIRKDGRGSQVGWGIKYSP